MKFQGRWPPSIAIVAVEAFEFNDSGARFRRIGRLSFLYATTIWSMPEMVDPSPAAVPDLADVPGLPRDADGAVFSAP